MICQKYLGCVAEHYTLFLYITIDVFDVNHTYNSLFADRLEVTQGKVLVNSD